MNICNCTLAGTAACKTCPNNSLISEFDFPTTITFIEKSNIERRVGHPVIQYWCSECEASLSKYDKYCHNCGCIINWEDAIDD